MAFVYDLRCECKQLLLVLALVQSTLMKESMIKYCVIPSNFSTLLDCEKGSPPQYFHGTILFDC